MRWYAPPMMKRRDGAWLRLVAAMVLVWGGLYVFRTSFVVDGERVFVLWDDAMISMRYAENLARGHGLAWNPGEEPVQGFSNPAITLAMAALHLLPIATTRISLLVQVANLLGLAAIPLLTHRLACAWFGDDPRLATLATLAVAACAPLAIWGLQGSDTTAVCLWLLTALVIHDRTDGRRPELLYPFLALGLLIRLDTALLGAVFVVAACLSPADRLRHLLWSGASYATVLLGFLVLSLWYYGDPLPNTFYMKATGMPWSRMLEWGFGRLLGFWYTAVPAAMLAVFAVSRFWHRRPVPILGGLVAVAFAYDVGVGSDWAAQYGSRFTAPVLPLLLVLVCAGARELLRDHVPARLREARGADLSWSAAILLVCVLASPYQARVDWFDPRAPTMFRAENVRNARLGLYLREHTAPSTRLAVHWGGLVPYLSRRPAIDVYGRSDRHIARLEVSRFVPGHAKRDWRYVLDERKPDVIPISAHLENVPRFVEQFHLVRSGEVSFFAHRDSLHLIRDRAAVVRRQAPASARRRSPAS